MQNMKGSGSKDVYRMLKELAPSRYVEDELLLNLDDFVTNADSVYYKRNLIQRINRIFGTGWEIGHEDYEIEDDNRRVRFEIGNDGNGKFAAVYHDSNDALAVTFNQVENYGYADLIILTDGKKISEKLIVKRNEKTGKLVLYTVDRHQKIVRYLGIDLSDKAKRSIAEIKSRIQNKYQDHTEVELESSSEVLEVKNNRDNWLYCLVFRGFLTFLAGESQLYDLRKVRKEIRDVISEEWVVEEAPFLEDWEYFEKVGFDVIGTLRNIGAEFINQVIDENIDNDYLFIRVAQRYYNALSSYFYWFDRSFNKDYAEEYKKYEIHNKLQDYHLKTLQLLRTALSKEIEDICKLEELHRNEITDIAIMKEVDDIITADSNAIISLDELANKYHLQNSRVLTLFASAVHNDYYNDTHIIIDTYLIPYSIIAPFFLIEDNARFEDVFSLLYTIPKSLHTKLIRRLGFDIVQKKWNDYKDATIAKRKKIRIQIS